MTELATTLPRTIDAQFGATLRSLQQRYDGQPIEVSFRELVGPLPADELTHSIYPYPARLLRQIPRMLFSCEQIVGDIDHIIDPFCGAGTTLVEAQRGGITSSGIEQNPIGVLASRVKTTWLDVLQFTTAASVVLESAKRGRRRAATPAYLERWYSSEAHSALSRLTLAVKSQPSGPIGDALALALALTAKRVADTDRRIPVPVRPRELRHFRSTDVWYAWNAEIRRVSRSLERLRPRSARAHVVSGDSRETSSWAQALSGERTLIFTSPPYGAAQKYIRSTSLELGWLGYAADRGTIALEKNSIGREHLGQEETHRSREQVFSPLVEQAVSAARAVSSVRGAIYATYFADMERVFNHVGQRSARIVLVSGTNTVGNLELDTYSLLGDMVRDHGFKRTLSLRDEIRGRSFMTKRRSASNPARAEYIEIFERGE